ncbi:MAG: hypothetical protein QOG04_1533 [Actinomycetota bacterium]|jgi:uncharacterized protein (DUF302 family)|nr:hypothetical protein [Actinomycetota bacterium]
MTEYGYTVEVPQGYDEAVIRARLALKGEGFSILTESHIGGMLGPDAGSERQYLIMGAWNTGQHQDHGTDVRVAVNLPCNVVVQEQGTTAFVAALDPHDSIDPGNEESIAIADAARDALGRAFDRILEFG